MSNIESVLGENKKPFDVKCARVKVVAFDKLGIFARIKLFPYRFALLALLGIVLAHLAFVESLGMLTLLTHSPLLFCVLTLAGIAVFLAAAVSVYVSRLRAEPGVLMILLAVASTHVTAVAFHDLLASVRTHQLEYSSGEATSTSAPEPTAGEHLVALPATSTYRGMLLTLSVALIALVPIVIAVHAYRRQLTDIRTFAREECVPNEYCLHETHAAKFLVIPVSAPNLVPGFGKDGAVTFQKGELQVSLPQRSHSGDVKERTAALLEDIRALDGIAPNWQQLMRSLLPHMQAVEKVLLIGSAPEHAAVMPKGGPAELSQAEQKVHGSRLYLSAARRLLDRYCAPNAVQEVNPVGRDGQAISLRFDDVPQLASVLRATVRGVAGEHGHDACVDVTGGQKSTTIAGAQITLQNGTLIQYVNTGANPSIQLMDIRVDLPPELGH